MNEIIDVMVKRRSIRHYLAKQISNDDLNCILTAGLYAANGGNLQHPRWTQKFCPTWLKLFVKS